jgi:hypothetical protein
VVGDDQRSPLPQSDTEPQREAKGYSRLPKDGLGLRLSRKIDRLLDEIRDQQFSSEDPPAPALGGKAEWCADEPAADGGVIGLPLPPASKQQQQPLRQHPIDS